MRKTIILFVVLILIGSSCGLYEPSIITDSNCSLPCWNSIDVGTTTKDDYLRIIENLEFIDGKSIYTRSINTDFISVLVSAGAHKIAWFYAYGIEGWFSNNILEDIYFNGGLGLNIGEIIDLFGEPEYIYAGRVDASGRIMTFFISPSKGIYYSFFVTSTNSEITSKTKLEGFGIYNPNYYEEMIRIHFFPFQEKSQLYTWNGYGNIKDLYWPKNEP